MSAARKLSSHKGPFWNFSTVWRGVVVWFCLITVEVLHGVARVLWLVPAVGDLRARQIGVFTGSLLILIVAASFIRWIRPVDTSDAMSVGITWLMMTLAFELGFGRYVMHAPWSRIIADYNLLQGGLMPVGLVVLAVAPVVAARFRRVMPWPRSRRRQAEN